MALAIIRVVGSYTSDLPAGVQAYLQQVPEGARIRGMFLNWVLNHVEQSGHPLDGLSTDGRLGWGGFRWVPLGDYLGLLTRAMMRIHPHLPVEEAIRRHGHYIYENFSSTMVGKSVFAGALSPLHIIRLAPRCYNMVVFPGRVTVDLSDDHIAVDFENMWTFNESLQLGTWEGVLRKLGIDGTARSYRLSETRTRIDVEISRGLIKRWEEEDTSSSGPSVRAPTASASLQAAGREMEEQQFL